MKTFPLLVKVPSYAHALPFPTLCKTREQFVRELLPISVPIRVPLDRSQRAAQAALLLDRVLELDRQGADRQMQNDAVHMELDEKIRAQISAMFDQATTWCSFCESFAMCVGYVN